MRYTTLLILLFLSFSCEPENEDVEVDFPTPYELSKEKETATYDQVITFYIKLAREFQDVNIQTIGTTDSGNPLHVVTYNKKGDFNFSKIGDENTIVLINNGIHPGESDGIDATMLLFRDLASGKIKSPKDVIITTIPIYNVGGALNRNQTTRANQNGPVSYGFRGNAKNYDLNRDFIKADTENAKTFYQIFHLIQPHIFIDNHVSNGADYQYVLTHLFTQHNKLGGNLGTYIHDNLMPQLKDSLNNNNWEITPYVNVFNRPPETGFSQFLDNPRYSTGYTTLWNTLGMMVETHMLKPYNTRVIGTYTLLQKMIAIAEKDGNTIRSLQKKADSLDSLMKYYPISWQVDTTRNSIISFKGFKADTVTSEVTGLPRLKYNRDLPFEKPLVYNDYYAPTDSIKIPKAYIIKKQWKRVVELLKLNSITYTTLKKDTTITVESYKINEFNTNPSPYEGHYLHNNTKVQATKQELLFTNGDVLVETAQPGIRYLLETLEPAAVDSFFNWNFFDTILQQKEGFSPYVFEDTAVELLKKDSILNLAFQQKKSMDTTFSKNWYQQLDWLFKQSNLYEPAHLQYPIYRILKN